jgi:hypothetical protein
LCAAPLGGTLAAMTAAGEPRRLALEVQFDAEPIQGRLYDHEDQAGLNRPFSGWLGLMAAIDAARGVDGPPSHQRPEGAP